MPENAGESASSRPKPPPITRGEWALILVLVAIQFTHMVDFVIIMPLGERFMKEFEIGPEAFSWIVAVYLLAAGVASLVASLVVDRFDRKTVLLTMYAGFGISTLLCGLAPTYETLLVARALAGICGGLAAATIMSVIGDVFPPEKRGRASGAITSAFAVASVVGVPVGLVLTDYQGRGAPFVVLAALSAVVWVVAAFRLPNVRGHMSHARQHPLKEFADIAKEGNHLRAFAFTFFLVLGTFTVGSFSAPYLSTTNGWTEKQLAKIYFAAGVFTLIGMHFVGQLADRYSRLMLFRAFAGVTILAMIAITNLPPCPLWVAALAVSAFMVFSAGRMVPAQAMLLGTAVPRARGPFMTLNTSMQYFASGFAPVLAGWFITKSADGKIHGYPVVGLVAVTSAVVSLVLAGTLRPARVTVSASPQPESKPEPETEPETVAAV